MIGVPWLQSKLRVFSVGSAARGLPGSLRARADQIAAADRVVVRKSEHKLYLYSGDRLLGSYKVKLGLAPIGQKEREHDFRTPEGHYRLARRNTRSDYFLSIQVSYPNKDDEVRARKHRWAPGGLIMIHGLPNYPKHPADLLRLERLDRRLHRAVQFRHGRGLDAHSRQHSDRHLSVEASRVENHDLIVRHGRRPGRAQGAASSTCRSRKSQSSSIRAKAACIPCFASARSPC